MISRPRNDVETEKLNNRQLEFEIFRLQKRMAKLEEQLRAKYEGEVWCSVCIPPRAILPHHCSFLCMSCPIFNDMCRLFFACERLSRYTKSVILVVALLGWQINRWKEKYEQAVEMMLRADEWKKKYDIRMVCTGFHDRCSLLLDGCLWGALLGLLLFPAHVSVCEEGALPDLALIMVGGLLLQGEKEMHLRNELEATRSTLDLSMTKERESAAFWRNRFKSTEKALTNLMADRRSDIDKWRGLHACPCLFFK